MNLITDKWITVRRCDRTIDVIAPYQISDTKKPVSEVISPRPDFRGALYQFLIGLVQTAFAPEDYDEWEQKWINPPSEEELKASFKVFVDAFELTNDKGPAFMQDLDLPADAEETEIRSLLIDAPGGNTIKNNTDHFVKRSAVTGLCDACTATALYSLQTNAPSGGQGHRTGMRGGGPLTTIVMPDERLHSLWSVIWLNIMTLEERLRKKPTQVSEKVFPWIGKTQTSKNDEKTYPENVNEFQMYWGMPRRIRLSGSTESGVCDICGNTGPLRKTYRSINYGINYSSTWIHSLSPYRRREETDDNISMIAMKGKQGGFTYQDWLALTLVNNSFEQSASVLSSFNAYKLSYMTQKNCRVWCFGYYMEKMKARCWYDQLMPIIELPADKKILFIDEVRKLIVAADDTARILHEQIKAAWFNRPKEAKGDTSFILSSFWKQTEAIFFETTKKIREAVCSDLPTDNVKKEWRNIIIGTAEQLFDQFALQDTDDCKKMKRICEAAKALTNILNSPKTKTIHALMEG